MRTRPGSVVPCSLHAIRYVGFQSFGQSEIWSMTAGPCVVTTFAVKPLASVTSFVGSAWASACDTCWVDEFASGVPTPNSG